MLNRRMQYGMLLLSVGLYHLASGEWISWILLLVVLGLPWLSLLLSIPVILDFQTSPAGSGALAMGEEAELWLLGSSNWPMPPFRGRLRVQNCLTGKQWRYEAEDGLPTDHCGGFTASVEKARICDYMGIFAIPVRNRKTKTVIVRPRPVPVDDLTSPRQLEANRWVPKPGGGFSENHEHRLYRPGDSLNQVHWKLSAKVGELILREPMEPVRGTVLLSMTLRGTAGELDRKFGRLLWVGQKLLEQDIGFQLRVLTGNGLITYAVDSGEALQKAVDALLCTPRAQSGSIRDYDAQAAWHYHIGGDPDA